MSYRHEFCEMNIPPSYSADVNLKGLSLLRTGFQNHILAPRWGIFGGSVGEDDLSGCMSEVLPSRKRLVSGLNDLVLLEQQTSPRRFWPWVSDIETIQLRLDRGLHAFSRRDI
jgi:hypothetical protein